MNKATRTLPAPPRAEQRPYSYERHGVTIDDPWALAAGQELSRRPGRGCARLSQGRERLFRSGDGAARGADRQLFEEMKGRIKEDDARSRSRTATGSTGRRSSRAPNTATGIGNPPRAATATLIYSENAEAEGKEYYRLGAFAVSPDGKLLATLVDDDGSERFKLVVRDLATGKDIETVTEVGIGNPVWTSDSTRPRVHRGQRPVAQLPRPLSPHRRRPGQGGDALRGEGRHRFLGRGRRGRPTTA